MTIILFLIDSSASMAQRNYMGCSGIDTAKSIVQDILKLRQRDSTHRQTDRYMLFSTEEFPSCVKAGWKETSGVFHDQLKALKPCGKSPLKQAIMSALHFVNLNRAQSGVDGYGQGRLPMNQENVIIISISDGSAVADLPADFELRTDAKNALPFTDLTEEAFRWDQRMFSIVLRMRAQAPVEPRHATCPVVMHEPGVIQRVCASTGGRSFSMASHKQQGMIIEQLIQMILVNGLVLRFEFPAPGILPRNGQQQLENGELSEERKSERAGEELKRALEQRPITFMFTRHRGLGHWPIPEAYWPDQIQNATKFPQRKAHPLITIGINPTEAQVYTDFPFDKYELDPKCPITAFVKERTTSMANANLCWQVYINNSYRTPGVGKPFGYLKTAMNGTSVNLFLMPYNYPVLVKLLEEQKADGRLRGHPEWRRKLEQFVETSPSYYKQTLKKALARIKLTGGLLDEPTPIFYGPALNKLIANMKMVGKDEMEKLLPEIGARVNKPPRDTSYKVPVEKRAVVVASKNFRVDWEVEKKARIDAAKVDEPPKKKIRSRLPIPAPRSSTQVIEDDIAPDPELPEAAPAAPEIIPNMVIDLFARASVSQVYRTPFDIDRGALAQMLPRLRLNLDQQLRDSPIPALEGGMPGVVCKLQTAYEMHSQRAADMGNYDDYIKSAEAIGAGPLREVEHRAMRENTFGNPFKKDKKNMSVDEVGEAPAAAREATPSGMSKKDRRAMESNRPPRRKAGPLALDSMQMWRERRRTNTMSMVSDLSHTADDLTEEGDEDEEEREEGEADDNNMELDEMAADLAGLSSLSGGSGGNLNGRAAAATAAGAASPAGSSVSLDSGVSAWGLEDEAESEEEDEDVMMMNEDDEEGEEAAGRVRPSRSSRSLDDVGNHQRRRFGAEASLDRLRQLKGEVCSAVRRFSSDESILSSLDSLLSSLSMDALLVMTKFARDEAMRFKKKWLSKKLSERSIELETVANNMI